ncbi:hypothetical protein [Lacrimispora sp. 210928-DFI.3.58]|uniref:hypothetical protein n=1 Tax=Lacrimispora sp. 210928-DFI.3.58 TaxID=2883214 RepID=UPI001D05F673|nr:hypothetical protein [Lacrimispora sp. 210928-DFI.3.58]MCB7320917.1 hypothetical protein [Lacrimispora sp. 210928-DFI.3.58]
MDKERIYYGELVPLADGEPARIPAMVLISDDTKKNCGLPEKAKEILAFCKDRRPLYPGNQAVSRLIREEDVVVLVAQICPTNSRYLKELTGYLNAAAMQYVDHAVASSFGLGEILSQNEIHEEKQKKERGD